MQSLPLNLKIKKTEQRIKEWYEYYNGNVYVSFSGGLDSTVLLHIVRNLYPNVEAVFINTGLEYPEINNFVRAQPNVTILTPEKSFKWVIENKGFPVISKRVSKYILDIRRAGNEETKTKTLRLTGINSKGKYCPSMKLSNKWKFLVNSPFLISDECCRYLKKIPMEKYAKKSGKTPMTGEMASESNMRQQTYLKYGCNSFSSNKSTPMGFWTRQDVLEYIYENNIDYSLIYGEIKKEGELYINTGEFRTGCMFCMFGVHLEKHPNRFETMKISHPKHWKLCIESLKLKSVLEYIGVEY